MPTKPITTTTILPATAAAPRNRHQRQIARVCELLHWQPQQYCLHQFEQYLRFTDELAGFSDAISRQLRYAPAFRAFWNKEWATRNTVSFLPYAADIFTDLADLTAEYLYTHNALRLITNDAFYLRFEAMLVELRVAGCGLRVESEKQEA